MDEFAFLSNNLADEFMASVFPTLSSSEESKLVLVSTPAGKNHFYKIWHEAEEGINGFVAVRGWWNELHDEAWAEKQHKLLGDVKFKAEVECVAPDTVLEVYNTEIGKIEKREIGDLYERSISNLLVKTPYGFVPFDAITKKKGEGVCIQFEKTILKCALNHKVQLRNGTFVEAKSLKVGSIVSPNHRVVSIRLIGELDLYDLVNVANPDHSYYTNGVVSHNCEFMGSANTLVDGTKVSQIPYTNPKSDQNGLRIFEAPIKGHQYFMTVDVSRGRGLDYSAFIVFDTTSIPYRVVATFKNNKVSAMELPTLIAMVGRRYNEATVLIENNDLGESVANDLWFNLEYTEVIWTRDGKIAGGGTIGVRTTKAVKSKGCANIKEIIENDQIVLNDLRILEELSVYVLGKNGSYSAQDTRINDDLCACLFLFGWLTGEDYFVDITNINTSAILADKFKKQLEDESFVPFGFIDNGINDHEHPKLSDDQISLLS